MTVGGGFPVRWTEVDEEPLGAELCFMMREIYLLEVEVQQDVLTARERYRAF